MLAQSPFQWLQDLSQRAKQQAKGLPHHNKVESLWRGIAFRLSDIYLVTSLEEICEILPYINRLAKVPGAKSWVKGLANVRGLLLPVIDLNGCLEDKPTMIERHTRVLIIKQSDVSAGLLVNEVFGIKYFPEHTKDLNIPIKPDWIAPFARGQFMSEKITWTVFDTKALVKNDSFIKAAR